MTALIQLPQVLVLLNKKLLRLHFNLGLEHSRKLNVSRDLKTHSSSHSDPGKALTNLVLWVKSFHTLLELCVKIDDSTCDGVVGDLVAIVHQDEEQVKPGHQLLVMPNEWTNTKKLAICWINIKTNLCMSDDYTGGVSYLNSKCQLVKGNLTLKTFWRDIPCK